MPLIEIGPNILIHTGTGLYVVRTPGVKTTVFPPGDPGGIPFVAPRHDPDAAWEAIRAHATPSPVAAPADRLAALERDVRRLADRVEAMEGRDADARPREPGSPRPPRWSDDDDAHGGPVS